MARQTIKVSRYGDTIRIQVHMYYESFDATYRTEDEIIDYCHWVAVTGGVSLSKETVEEMLRANKVIV